MSDLAIIPQPQQQPAKQERTLKVTGKVKAAIEAMVWDGLPREKAAEHAGISEHGLYKALRKAPVKAFYLAELEVLRTSERARNVKRLAEIRDAGNNMPAVQAIGMLERMSEESSMRSGASVAAPGLTVVIMNAPVPGPSPIEIGTRLTQQRELPNDNNE